MESEVLKEILKIDNDAKVIVNKEQGRYQNKEEYQKRVINVYKERKEKEIQELLGNKKNEYEKKKKDYELEVQSEIKQKLDNMEKEYELSENRNVAIIMQKIFT